MPDVEEQERLGNAARRVGTAARERLSHVWWWFLVRGVLAVALGLFALFWPGLSLSTLVVVVGCYCLADGVTGLIAAFRSPNPGDRLPAAFVSLAIGALLVLWPAATLRLTVTLFGLLIAYLGCSQWLSARRLPADDPDRRLLSGIGIVAAFGGAVMIFWPASGVSAIAWVIGIAALLIGIALILLGLRFRRLGQRLGPPP
jgi:uncharacterized membrane protein HdeD (DUF308 family)